MAAWDRQICSDLVYAGYLGFQANLHNFHNPVANQFTALDYETFLREHIMQTMPYRNEAEAATVAIQEAYEEALNEYEDAIRSYYVYLLNGICGIAQTPAIILDDAIHCVVKSKF